MKIVNPIQIDDTTLTSTNVPLDYTEWTAGTYSLGDIRVYNERVYEVVADSTSDAPDVGVLLETPTWVELSYSNKWRMFRDGVDSRSSTTGDMEFTVAPGQAVTVAAFLEVYARYIHVKATDPVEGVVFDETIEIPLGEGYGITDWWEYFFSPFEDGFNSILIWFNFSYPDAEFEFTVEPDVATDPVHVGRFVIGVDQELGCTVYGTNIDLQDFSIKERDSFGNLYLRKRRTIKHVNYNVEVNTSDIDWIARKLQKLTSTPMLFIGYKNMQALVTFGIYQEMQQDISNWSTSTMTLQVEEY